MAGKSFLGSLSLPLCIVTQYFSEGLFVTGLSFLFLNLMNSLRMVNFQKQGNTKKAEYLNDENILDY